MKLPQSYNDLTIGQYVQLISIKETDLVDYEIKVISILTGLTTNEVEALPFAEFTDLIKQTIWLNDFKINEQLSEEISLENKTYRIILNPKQLTAGQYIDLKMFTKESDKVLSNLAEILATLAIEKGKEYSGETHSERSQFFYDKMPLGFAYPIAVFFCKVYPTLINFTQDYFLRQSIANQREALKKLKATMKGGVGL